MADRLKLNSQYGKRIARSYFSSGIRNKHQLKLQHQRLRDEIAIQNYPPKIQEAVYESREITDTVTKDLKKKSSKEERKTAKQAHKRIEELRTTGTAKGISLEGRIPLHGGAISIGSSTIKEPIV